MAIWFRLMMLVLACAALITTGPSNATQAVSSSNPSNTFTATTTGLTASVTNALFNSNNLQPGDVIQRCINLRNTGPLAFTSVAISGVSTGTISDEIDVNIDTGTGTTGNSCTGFVQTDADIFADLLGELPTASDPLVDTTDIAINASVSYRITMTLPADVDQSTQGQSTSFVIRWEVRS